MCDWIIAAQHAWRYCKLYPPSHPLCSMCFDDPVTQCGHSNWTNKISFTLGSEVRMWDITWSWWAAVMFCFYMCKLVSTSDYDAAAGRLAHCTGVFVVRNHWRLWPLFYLLAGLSVCVSRAGLDCPITGAPVRGNVDTRFLSPSPV